MLELLAFNAVGKYEHLSTSYPGFQLAHATASQQQQQLLQTLMGVGVGLPSGGQPVQQFKASPTTMTFTVQDSMAPVILGRSGSALKEITQRTGATVRVSPKGELLAGSTDRVCVHLSIAPLCVLSPLCYTTCRFPVLCP